MTDDFKQYVLKNVPTKILLREFKAVRWFHYRNLPTDRVFRIGEELEDGRVRITVGKFAYWNPYKGHRCECIFSQDEVKEELSKREHIQRKIKKTA